MPKDDEKQEKKPISADWLIGGVLSRVGDTLDRLTGRKWNPSSSLATSQLVERLTAMMDSEVREEGKAGRFVPHLFKLKIQWNKFSTEAEDDLMKLENELHAAVIDHINDRLYHTYGPVSISIARDYFVEGVEFTAGFGKGEVETEEEAALKVSLDSIPIGSAEALPEPEESPEEETGQQITVLNLKYRLKEKERSASLELSPGDRRTVGRGGTNDLVLDDISVSKSHAAIAMNRSGEIVIGDTGSTNGTFVNGRRMAYGKAIKLASGDTAGFGDVEVKVSLVNVEGPNPAASKDLEETVAVGASGELIDSPLEDPAPAMAAKIEDTGIAGAEKDPETGED